MKLTIITKLFLMSIVPIIALLLFSLSHLEEKYSNIQIHKTQFSYSEAMHSVSNLIHEIQLERGYSISYLNNIDPKYFKSKLLEQFKKTDTVIKRFDTSMRALNAQTLSKATNFTINKTDKLIENIYTLRKDVLEIKTNKVDVFDYYTKINDLLLEFTNMFNFRSNNAHIDNTIFALQKLIVLKEYAGQERALVENLVYKLDISNKDLKNSYTLISMQDKEYKNLVNILEKDTNVYKKLLEIHNKYKDSFITITRDSIAAYEDKKLIINEIFKLIGYGGFIHNFKLYKKTKNDIYHKNMLEIKPKFDKKIQEYISLSKKGSIEYTTAIKLAHAFDKILINPDYKFDPIKVFMLYKYLDQQHLKISPVKWFEVSSQRINDFLNLENLLFVRITESIATDQKRLENSLLYQMMFTTFVILFLLITGYTIAHKIKTDIIDLKNGLSDFFEFLNFKRDHVDEIIINSNDELKEMADEINKQISIIKTNLKSDKDFINEATDVVKLMKDGDFTKRVYYQPNNPNLRELKYVLNELINLITQKIDEQTESLEKLNNSLEEKVMQQTNELRNKIEEITIARDKAIQAEIAKDEFLANMSHEIRTPLNAILGFVTILKKQIDDEKNIKYLNIIDASGQSLLTIINDILDFSKIQSGKFIISKRAVSPLEEFSNAVLLFASKAYEKNIIYSVYIDPNMPSKIMMDETRVKQILSNILSNAIKFTPNDGEIKVKIVTEDSNLIISVQDTGIGISKENQKKVFSAFEQADGSTTRKYGGTGLGLSISSKLANLMNGKLFLNSEEGKGSTFILNLPVDIIDNEPSKLIDKQNISRYTFAILNNSKDLNTQAKLIKKYLQDFGVTEIIEIQNYDEYLYDVLFFTPDDEYNENIVSSQKPSIAMLRTSAIKLANLEHLVALYAPFIPQAIVEAINEIGLKDIKPSLETDTTDLQDEEEIHYDAKVLVAEDNKTNQMLISLILEDYSIEFDIANDGIEAVDMFKKSKYDLVLMDENMPNLNGIGAMQQIKAYESENSLIFTPIIALTASVLDTDKEKFINAGMDGFVGKPIDTDELEAVFNKYLKKEE